MPGPASSDTDRPSTLCLCRARPLQMLTEPSPHTCASTDLCPAPSDSDRASTSYLCQAPHPWTLTDQNLILGLAVPPRTLTDPAPHTCARFHFLRHQQTQRLITVPSSPLWTLTDQNLIPVPGPASLDTNRPTASYLCHALNPQTIRSNASCLCQSTLP